jgi:PAS domain S-box-containing protein
MSIAKSNPSAGRADTLFRIIVGTAAAFGVLYIGLYFLRKWEPTLAEIPMFVPMIHGFVVLESITIAFLALGSHRALRNPVTYWIGIAFASIAIFNMFYILSWPGLHADGRQVMGFIPGTAAWIITIAQIVFSVLLITGVSVRWPGAHSLKGRNWTWSVVIWLVLTALANVLVISFEDYLPSMIGPGGTFTLLQLVVVGVVGTLYATGTVMFTRYYFRSRDILTGYIALDLLLLFYNSVGILMTTKRYTPLWYTSRLLAIAGGMIVLFGLLWAYVRLYQKEQEKSRDLEASITERRQAEVGLKESEARLNRSQAMALLGSWELDVVNDVLVWSDEVYRIFGLQAQEFKATYAAFLEAVHPNDRKIVDEAYLGSLREGKDTYEIEHRIVRKSDSELRIVHEKCEHVRDQSGRIIRSLGMVHDITERKQASERITTQNAVLKGVNRILEAGLSSATEEDLGNTCLKVAEEITGSAFAFIAEIGGDGMLHDLAISDPGWEACAMLDKSGHRRLTSSFRLHGLYGLVLVEGKSLIVNDPSSHPESIGVPEGHPSLNAFLGVPLMREGTTIGIIAVANREGGYSTEQQEALESLAPVVVEALGRKRAEEALRESKDKLELRVKERTAELNNAVNAIGAERQRLYGVLETLPAYVALLTTDYRVAFANRVFRERFGESQGKRCFEFLFNRTEPCEICETYRVLETSAPHHWEWTGPDGRNYDVFDFPFTDTDGSLLILEMGIDITERKQAENALNRTLADLQRSNADLEHFAHVASHDLQEPLRSVATALQMLQEKNKGRLGAQSDQLIDYAVDAAKRMKALISDLLTYSRVTTRGQSFEPVIVQEVLNQSILNLAELISRNGTKITHDQMPIIKCDSTQLLQIFQNLVGNAVKFGPSESSKIHVSVEKQGSEWVFSVQDNGIGIDSKYFDRIFVIFQQLDKKGPFHGTGMGLAIVKKIVERHRGRVWVESEVGVGSKFYFTMPDDGLGEM